MCPLECCKDVVDFIIVTVAGGAEDDEVSTLNQKSSDFAMTPAANDHTATKRRNGRSQPHHNGNLRIKENDMNVSGAFRGHRRYLLDRADDDLWPIENGWLCGDAHECSQIVDRIDIHKKKAVDMYRKLSGLI